MLALICILYIEHIAWLLQNTRDTKAYVQLSLKVGWSYSSESVKGLRSSTAQLSSYTVSVLVGFVIAAILAHVTWALAQEWVLSIRTAKTVTWALTREWVSLQYLWQSWPVQNNSKHVFSPIPTDLLALQVTQMPRSPKLAIFLPTTTNGQTNHFTPLRMCAG